MCLAHLFEDLCGSQKYFCCFHNLNSRDYNLHLMRNSIFCYKSVIEVNVFAFALNFGLCWFATKIQGMLIWSGSLTHLHIILPFCERHWIRIRWCIHKPSKNNIFGFLGNPKDYCYYELDNSCQIVYYVNGYDFLVIHYYVCD